MLSRVRKTIAAAGAFAAVLLHGTAMADVMFTGSGTWAGDADFTTLSAPNATWSFAFVLPSTLGASATSTITSFSYRLSGVSIASSPSVVTFFTAADGGMFDIAFGAALPSFSLYGDPVLANGAFTPGSYSVFAGISGGQTVGAGSIAIVALPVPEPATWAFCALGLAVLAVSRRRPAFGALPTPVA